MAQKARDIRAGSARKWRMDETDKRIAALLQVNGRRGADELAAEIGLSASAVHRRIVRMREEGVIAAELAVLDPKAFGIGITFIVEIVLEKVRVPEVSAIKKRLKAAPEVQQIYNVTGDVDLMLIVLARDVEHFEEISRNLFSADPLVRRYRTSVVMDRVKTGQTIPVG
ncbi:MAG: Lrp/AsnC family transcriptional regulator [Hyphomonadaceae bacterium]|nr:Lrp/AsnC family transcriptional regulator [Hyphomonadaceae bacterium]